MSSRSSEKRPGSASDRPQSSRGKSSKTNDMNMPATRELLKFSTEYIQNIGRLIDRSRTELEELETSVAHTRREKSSLEDKEKQLVAKNEEIQKLKDEYQKEIYKIQHKNHDLERDIERMKRGGNREENKTHADTKDYDDMKRRLERKEDELCLTKLELDETKLRLSKIMGDQLTNNNPNITDLSDMNRPTKLAERYKQLYDNQWTDAYEILERRIGEDENKIISILLILLIKTKEFCDQESKRQMEEIHKVITQSEKVRKLGVPDTVAKYIKDCRKESSADSMKDIYKKYETWLRTEPFPCSKYATSIREYIAECFEICWLMTIQDPPVVIASEPKKGETIKSELYSAYTISGNIVDFLVWPALLLHTGGPVLAKGVVQAPKRPKSAPAAVRHSRTKDYYTEHKADPRTMHANQSEDRWSSRKPHDAWTKVDDDRDKYRHEQSYEGQYRDKQHAYGDPGTYMEKDLRQEKFFVSHRRREYDQEHMPTELANPTHDPSICDRQYGPNRHERVSYIPSEGEVARYFQWRQIYGAQSARIMMGRDEYDRIGKYLKRP